MSKYEVLIKAVTIQGLSYSEVSRRHGVSKALIHKLHHRWLTEGDTAFHERSRRPLSTPNRTPESIRTRVLSLRHDLTNAGLDAGTVTAQPQKRPRSSWKRFAADRPNELWQSDFTHVPLTTGQDMEVIGWLDDHSRYLLHLSAHPRITGPTVTNTFTRAASEHGYPAATLTDNGMVYTTRFARGGANRGNNAFETLLALEGITQKNGKPYKPTTQGKVERFWQTLKQHLVTQPAPSLPELQHRLDRFREYYNQIRPHRGIGRRTPAFAYQLIPKATPTLPDDPGIWRVRYDTIDNDGKISLRHHGRMTHLGIGRAYNRTEVICLIHNNDATVITHDGTVLAEFTLDPSKGYQTKNG
ncbi:MAG: integrase core domain-containing protein [Homoserinimonas sp.]